MFTQVFGLLANPNRRVWIVDCKMYILRVTVLWFSVHTLYGLNFARSTKPPVKTNKCKVSTYVTAHGGFYLVLTRQDSRGFKYLPWNSHSLQQHRQWLPFTTRVTVNSAEQCRVDWLISFSKMTNTLRQCTFRDIFPLMCLHYLQTM